MSVTTVTAVRDLQADQIVSLQTVAAAVSTVSMTMVAMSSVAAAADHVDDGQAVAETTAGVSYIMVIMMVV